MTKRLITILILLLQIDFVVIAQNNFDDFRKRHAQSYDAYTQKKNQEYENFRKKINSEYAAMVKKTWERFNAFKGINTPEDNVKPVPPVVWPDNDKDKKSKEIPVIEVIPTPKPEPKPVPIAPVVNPEPQVPEVHLSHFGTACTVHFDKSKHKRLDGISETSISKQWKNMSDRNYDGLVSDCLLLRDKFQLCDWGYLELLNDVANAISGEGTNDATLLMAYMYCQSGYKMRLGRDDRKLYMLYASKHLIYRNVYYTINNENYYVYKGQPERLNICEASYPKEKEMSLVIDKEPLLSSKATSSLTRRSKAYPGVSTTMTSNKNLMEFYNTYPTSMVGGNECSRWALYANKPMQSSIKKQIYPSLLNAISGKSELVAVNMLLNYVQTGFEYEYDDKVWGGDRAFFAEESLYYPYCDCEDRSILFTRIVRDLLHLPCILIYYPGHLAAAVCFSENVNGDYVMLGNRKFIITDPTYINAPVGKTMPGMDNSKGKVILLGN